MFLGAGVGAYGAAIFMMIAHAFFKALLFLGAGSVIHGMHDEQDMRRMGGLRKWMPITAGTFIVGWLAIAGIVPFAGFWSKDDILAKAWFGHNYALWAIGVTGAVLTAFYMTRQVWLVFYGPERWRDDATLVDAPAEDAHAVIEPHESPWLMTTPLVVLAALSIFGGLLDLPFVTSRLDLLDRWLEPSLFGAHEPIASSFGAALALSTIALSAGIMGIIVGRAVYLNGLNVDGTDPAVQRLGGFARVLENGYYLDYGVGWAVSHPITWFANFLADDVDDKVIDGAVNGIGTVSREAGGGLRRIQTGLVRNYALAIVLGTMLLLVYMTTRWTL